MVEVEAAGAGAVEEAVAEGMAAEEVAVEEEEEVFMDPKTGAAFTIEEGEAVGLPTTILHRTLPFWPGIRWNWGGWVAAAAEAAAGAAAAAWTTEVSRTHYCRVPGHRTAAARTR